MTHCQIYLHHPSGNVHCLSSIACHPYMLKHLPVDIFIIYVSALYHHNSTCFNLKDSTRCRASFFLGGGGISKRNLLSPPSPTQLNVPWESRLEKVRSTHGLSENVTNQGILRKRPCQSR